MGSSQVGKDVVGAGILQALGNFKATSDDMEVQFPVHPQTHVNNSKKVAGESRRIQEVRQLASAMLTVTVGDQIQEAWVHDKQAAIGVRRDAARCAPQQCS